MSRKYFGTDGIRGRVGEGPINPEFVLRLGWAVGKVFARDETLRAVGRDRCKIIIGKDTRISGYMFESALEAGLVAAGIDVRLIGPMPTPAIAYLTRTFHACAGIVISASHNPFEDNGIKFFSAEGTKLPDSIEHEIEAMLEQPLTTVCSAKLGKVKRIDDAAGRYIEYCKSTIPMHFSLRGLNIVVDCANGATYHVAPRVFTELGAKVILMGCEPDGLNINDGVGSTSPSALQQRVLAEKADLGVAFDGDGDRLLFVDHKGETVDGDELLFIIANERVRQHGHCRGVVGTVMSNLGLELALDDIEVPFARAKVGDRYVVELMHSRGWDLGGENSGHIICGDVTTTGDGVVAALQVLYALVCSDTKLNDAKESVRKFPQIMRNVRHNGNFNLEDAALQQAIAEVEEELGEKGRVLLRPSGTEPVVRVMVEGEQRALVTKLCEELALRVEKLVA